MENIDFEKAIKELEQIVKELENNELSLEDAVKKYSRGLEISKICSEKLKENENLVLQKMSEYGLEEFKVEEK